jgi:hypothetical protein
MVRENLGSSTGRSRVVTKPAVPRHTSTSRSAAGKNNLGTSGGGASSGNISSNASSPGGVLVDCVGGIGVVLSMPHEGRRKIKSLTKAGPAEENGMIKVGDVLASVSGVDVKGLPGDVLRDMLVGEAGSSVRVGLERLDRSSGRCFFYEVNLDRATSGTQQPHQTAGNHSHVPSVAPSDHDHDVGSFGTPAEPTPGSTARCAPRTPPSHKITSIPNPGTPPLHPRSIQAGSEVPDPKSRTFQPQAQGPEP